MIAVLNLFDVIRGQEAVYAEYLRRVRSLLDRHHARVLLYGRMRARFMEAGEQEYCGIIAYETPDDLCRFSRDPEFVEIRVLRDRSTTNYALTVVEEVGLQESARFLIQDAISNAAPDSAATDQWPNGKSVGNLGSRNE